MGFTTSFTVHVEKPGTAHDEIMTHLRLWLGDRKIEPVSIDSFATGGTFIAFDVQFQDPHQTILFEREFP